MNSYGRLRSNLKKHSDIFPIAPIGMKEELTLLTQILSPLPWECVRMQDNREQKWKTVQAFHLTKDNKSRRILRVVRFSFKTSRELFSLPTLISNNQYCTAQDYGNRTHFEFLIICPFLLAFLISYLMLFPSLLTGWLWAAFLHLLPRLGIKTKALWVTMHLFFIHLGIHFVNYVFPAATRVQNKTEPPLLQYIKRYFIMLFHNGKQRKKTPTHAEVCPNLIFWQKQQIALVTVISA